MAGGGSVLDGQWAPSSFALFMVQVLIILCLSKALAQILKLLKQPAVVAEMLAGIILGPTVLGRIPGFSELLFPTESVKIIQVISSFALIFFMFIVGLELDPAKLKADLRLSSFISFFGVMVPFGASCLLTMAFMHEEYSDTSFINLALFLTCALGMSALPVLARILSERRMLTTRIGGLAMTVAAVDDIVAYALLALTVALIRSSSQLGVLWTILLTIGELLLMIFVVGPVIRWLVRKDDGHSHLNADTFLFLSLILIGSAYLTEVIGLSALIGAFQVGLLIPRRSNLSHHISEKLEYITVGILMPLYFTNSGLRTQFGLINDGLSVGNCIMVIAVSTISKIIGIMLPAMYSGVPTRISGIIGILMSCKGLVALIVVNIGIDYHIITPKFFAILVMMVLVTTIMTVPLMQCLDPASRHKQTAELARKWEEAMAEAAAKRALVVKGATLAESQPDKIADATSVRLDVADTAQGSGEIMDGARRSLSFKDDHEAASQTPGIARRTSHRSRTSTAVAMDPSVEINTAQVLHAIDGPEAVATIVVPQPSSDSKGPEPTSEPGLMGMIRGLSRRVSFRTRSDTAVGATHSSSIFSGSSGPGDFPGVERRRDSGLGSTMTMPSEDQLGGKRSANNPERRASASPTPSKPWHVVFALGETSAAPALVTVLNIFPSYSAAAASNPGAVVTLAWLLDSMDMPSSYMNITTSIEDIRDVTLSAALHRLTLREGMDVVTFPSAHPLEAAFEEAASIKADLVLCSDLFLREHAGILPTREDAVDLLRKSMVQYKPCAMGLYFDFGAMFPVSRILCPVGLSAHGVAALLDFLRRVDLSVEITFLHVSEPAPTGSPLTNVETVPTSDESVPSAAATVHRGSQSVGELADVEPLPRSSMVQRRRTTNLPTVIEMPTVGTFSAMLAGATDADLDAYRAAVEAARRDREGESAAEDHPASVADSASQVDTASTDEPRAPSRPPSHSTAHSLFSRTESLVPHHFEEVHLQYSPLRGFDRENIREVIAAGCTDLTVALEHVLTSASHAYDLVVLSADPLDFFYPASTAVAAGEAAVAYLQPLLQVLANAKQPVLVTLPKTAAGLETTS